MSTPYLQRHLHSRSWSDFWLHQQWAWVWWESDQPVRHLGGAQRYPQCHRVGQVCAEQAKPPAEHNLPALGATQWKALVAKLLTFHTQPVQRLRVAWALPAPRGPILAPLMLLVRQVWGTCWPQSRERSCSPPDSSLHQSACPYVKHGAKQGRAGCESTFGLNRECKHIPAYTAEAPESEAPPGSAGRVSVVNSLRNITSPRTGTRGLSTRGGQHLFQHHKFHTTSNSLKIC